MARMSYVVNTDGCHIWKKARNSRGYGVVWHDGKLRLAHRVAWLLEHGRWPSDGLVIDHICNVKECVNPAHLRELENWVNVRRAAPAKSDPHTERRRANNRQAQAKMRGTYSSSYSPERV